MTDSEKNNVASVGREAIKSMIALAQIRGYVDTVECALTALGKTATDIRKLRPDWSLQLVKFAMADMDTFVNKLRALVDSMASETMLDLNETEVLLKKGQNNG